jgi:hypothetical protein
MKCPNCGSEEGVRRDAWAEWDVAKQEWVIQNVFDHAICESELTEDCHGGEISIEEVEETFDEPQN